VALSLKRGEGKYSVLCAGEGTGWPWAAGLGTGSGEARLEACRFAWPGLSLENIDVPEGAIAVFRVAARPRSRCVDAGCRERRGLGVYRASRRGLAPKRTITGWGEAGCGVVGAKGRRLQKLVMRFRAVLPRRNASARGAPTSIACPAPPRVVSKCRMS
jgi:hypothetical protein